MAIPILAVLLSGICAGAEDGASAGGVACPVAGSPEVTGALAPILERTRVPAIAGAIVSSAGLRACAVVGVRKRGGDVAATPDDRWHLGSETKAMTATLIGVLVEEGALRWESALGKIFPDLSPGFHPAMREVTILQLLSHRAGFPRDLKPWNVPGSVAGERGSVREQRVRLLTRALASAPESRPGSEYRYSNVGYVIAGAIVERATGVAWEEAIRERLFDPLKMSSAGFGGLGTPGKIDQPWGHLAGGAPVSANGPGVDNPRVIGPAGRVHCTIQDWAKYVIDQLRGARGERALLRGESYRTLHTPPNGGDYALGWVVTRREWGGGEVLHHCGDNTMNHANVWIAPRRDLAVMACINQGGATAREAADAAVSALIRLVGGRPPGLTYSGDVAWEPASGTATFRSGGSMPETREGFFWEVPPEVKRIRIGAGVTVRGGFRILARGADNPLRIEGCDRATSVIAGTDLERWTDRNGVADNEKWKYGAVSVLGPGVVHVSDLTSRDPRGYHISGYARGAILHVSRCDIVDGRAGSNNNSDGFVGADGSTICDTRISTSDDGIKIYHDMTIRNVIIEQHRNGAAIQFGWGGESGRARATIENLEIRGADPDGRYNMAPFTWERGSQGVRDVSIAGLRVRVEGEMYDEDAREWRPIGLFELKPAGCTLNLSVRDGDIGGIAPGIRNTRGTIEIDGRRFDGR